MAPFLNEFVNSQPTQYVEADLVDPTEDKPDEITFIDTETPMPTSRSCEACGAPVEPGDRFCQACGTPQPEAKKRTDKPSRKYVQCKSCGSQIALAPDHRSYVCAFCGSTYVVEFSPDLTGRMDPEFVIGFAIPKEQAIEKFQQWIKANRWYHPNDLKQARLTDRIQGVYLPFWSFSVLARSVWSASIGEYWYRTETYTTTDSKGRTVTRTRQVRETEWWDLSGRHHRYYSGYLVSACNSLDHATAQRVMPFDLPALKRYEPWYLAGWASEEYTVLKETAYEVSKKYFLTQEQMNIGHFMPGDTYRNLSVRSQFSQNSYDLILLPYYLLTYKYREKTYRFLLNGQTGKVWGDKPLSKQKIWTAVGIGLLVIAAIVLLIIFLAGM